jgi:hypothetical protein
VVKKLFGKGGAKDKQDDRTETKKNSDLKAAISEVNALVAKKLKPKKLTSRLQAIKKKYRLSSLEKVSEGMGAAGEKFHFHAAINPVLDSVTGEVIDRITPPIAIDPPFRFNTKAGYARDEFARQLRAQEKAINAMDVGKWLANRGRFQKEGRAPESAVAQEEFRSRMRAKMVEKQIAVMKRKAEREGVPKTAAQLAAAAEAQVAELLRRKVALHDPDQVAGGEAATIKRFGAGDANSAIGSSWRTRAPKLEVKVNAWLASKGVAEEDRKDVVMGISLLPFVDV